MSIPDDARANFNTLLRAAASGDLALVECADTATGEPRYVLCAVGRDNGDYVMDTVRPSRAGQPLRGLSATRGVSRRRRACAEVRVRGRPGRF